MSNTYYTLHTLVCQIPLTHFIPSYVKYLLHIITFAFIGPAQWNQPPPLTRFCLLTGGPRASFRCLKTSSFLSVSRNGSASHCCALREALYKLIATIRYT